MEVTIRSTEFSGRPARFGHAVVVRPVEALALHVFACAADGARQRVLHGQVGQAIGADDFGHLGLHLVVLVPLRFQGGQHLALALGVHDVDAHALGLAEPVHPVDRLNEVVELEPDASEHLAVAMALEVAAAAGDDRLRGQRAVLAVAEVHDALLALVQVLCAPHADRFRDGLLDGVALVFKVVPDDEVVIGSLGQNLAHLLNARRHAVALLGRCGTQAHSHVRDQQALPVLLFAGRVVIAWHLVIAHIQLGQHIAVIGVSEVARALDEHRPARHPQPELLFLVRVQRQVAGLLAVALEEAGQGLAGVHHAQVAGVVDQLLESVRAGGGRRHELELDTSERRQELLIGLAAVAAQHRRFVQAGRAELARRHLALAHALIVRHVDRGRVIDFGVRPDEAQRHGAIASESLFHLAGELLAHAQRGDLQAKGVWVADSDLAHQLQLRGRLVQAEAGKDRPIPALGRPLHDVAGVGLECRVDLVQIDVEPVEAGQLYLAAKERFVVDHSTASTHLLTSSSRSAPACSAMSVSLDLHAFNRS